MSDSPQEHEKDRQLELYLDGQLSSEESAAFEQRFAEVEAPADILDAEREMCASLRRAFSPPDRSADQLQQRLSDHASPNSPETAKTDANRRRILFAFVAIAASLVLMVLFRGQGRQKIEPFFQPRSLTAIFEETVDQGFRPYYFCEDDDRFAMTFEKRQGVALRLADMPDDRRMIGLSYLGGLSRNTTAMLCYFQEEPVIVFVDREEFDNSSITKNAADQNLRVHRRKLRELILYEVSSRPQPLFIEFLQLR